LSTSFTYPNAAEVRDRSIGDYGALAPSSCFMRRNMGRVREKKRWRKKMEETSPLQSCSWALNLAKM